MIQGWCKDESIKVPGISCFFALFGIAVGVSLNWKNSRLGYWLNLIVVSAADIGFIVFVLIPGYIPFMPGALGPILWILAAIFSTIGLISSAEGEKVT